MATIPIPQKPLTRSTRAQSLLGSAGAAASLLLPKCPLCWMALTGSFATAGYTQWGFELGGLAIFLFALWRLIRRRSASTLRVALYLAAAAGTLACGAWLSLTWETRLAVWVALIAASLWLSRRPATAAKCACSQAA